MQVCFKLLARFSPTPRHMHNQSNQPSAQRPASLQRELAWQNQWATELQSIGMFSSQESEVFMCRYVDNRLILSDTKPHRLGAIRDFMHLSFYGSTVQLETVSDHKFLSFTINASNRTVVFNLPTETWSSRHPHSAGKWSARASGYHSRKALIRKYAWPPSSRPSQILNLRGFPESSL